MDFRTQINIVRKGNEISHKDRIVMMGSCFAENIGQKLIQDKFNVDLNPFGILYNPVSVAQSIDILLEKKMFEESDIFFDKGVYHSFHHHGKFSDSDKDKFLNNINVSIDRSGDYLKEASFLLVTFGTAYVYEYKKTGKIVSNCHKVPASEFQRCRLNVACIVTLWDDIISKLHAANPNLTILFTVSPIRHLRDGLHDNQLSKSTLLLAIDELRRKFSFVGYFPSYEILIDDLRDYRFYDEDLVHPNHTAINYVWEVFAQTHFSKNTQGINKEWGKISQALQHRPFNTETEEHKHFLKQTLLKLESFHDKYPYIYCDNEISSLKDMIS